MFPDIGKFDVYAYTPPTSALPPNQSFCNCHLKLPSTPHPVCICQLMQFSMQSKLTPVTFSQAMVLSQASYKFILFLNFAFLFQREQLTPGCGLSDEVVAIDSGFQFRRWTPLEKKFRRRGVEEDSESSEAAV